MLKLSVVVPIYQQSLDLARCLSALQQQQHRPADEVIVIVRDLAKFGKECR